MDFMKSKVIRISGKIREFLKKIHQDEKTAIEILVFKQFKRVSE